MSNIFDSRMGVYQRVWIYEFISVNGENVGVRHHVRFEKRMWFFRGLILCILFSVCYKMFLFNLGLFETHLIVHSR